MKKKKWTIGFAIAVLFGLLSAGAGVAAGMGWHAFVAVLSTSLATHLGAYLMKHPVEDVEFDTDQMTKPPEPPAANHFGLWLLCGFLSVGLLATGCVTSKRLEAGGAYAASATQAAQPELFAVDASYDVAYSALDGVFKWEKANRAVLWKLSPTIKHTLDKIRAEAATVNMDYAIARQAYLASPTAPGLSDLLDAVGRMQNLNLAALAVVATKGQ